MRVDISVQPGYTPRQFDKSPLFRVVYDHFDDLQESWHRDYSERCGAWRSIVVHTVNRFLVCGDPREGVARYECPRCRTSIAVPFSCKTRLFCPSCHEIKTLVWIDSIQTTLLLPVSHRFWTFSIPKRLRYYFMRNRKLLGLMVAAAANTLAKSLTDGKLRANFRPGIVALIQTHSDSLDWNCHLHMIVTDGVVDYSDASAPVFKPCRFWDFTAMTEMFRFELIEMMLRKGVLTPEIAANLASWEHSGFHVHASWPFMPSDGELLRTRLAYAFRPAVTLKRLGFDGKTVAVTTRKQTLCLTPVEFLAKLVLHIPDRYQNVRRYAGFYASIVQCAVRRAAGKAGHQIDLQTGAPVRPKWATLIARIFGEMPIACPNCGRAMELAEFVIDEIPIAKLFPDAARAPPRKQFGRYETPTGEPVYGHADDEDAGGAEFNQIPKDDDAVFNQEIAPCPERFNGLTAQPAEGW